MRCLPNAWIHRQSCAVVVVAVAVAAVAVAIENADCGPRIPVEEEVEESWNV